MMLRGRAQYQDEFVPGLLIVDWSDDNQTDIPCMIWPENHMVCDLTTAFSLAKKELRQ
jgi:hypothetical protein